MTVVEPSPMLIANARGLAKALLSKDLPDDGYIPKGWQTGRPSSLYVRWMTDRS